MARLFFSIKPRGLPRPGLRAALFVLLGGVMTGCGDVNAAPRVARTAPTVNGRTTQLTSVTSRLTTGSRGAISAHTVPGATCVIAITAGGAPVGFVDESQKVADRSGAVAWSLNVAGTAHAGNYDAHITCNPGGSVDTTFRVVGQ